MVLDRTGSIAVENIDLSLSKRADKAQRESPGEGADAVLWEHLSDATHEESTLSLTSAKSGALVGFAISVTTVPAAANAAVAFAHGAYRQAWGSTGQLLLNLLGIVPAGTFTPVVQKWLWAQQRERTARTGRF